MSWETLAVVVVVLMVPFATVNPFLYARVANWRKSAEGRALMTSFVGLLLLVDLATLYQFLPWFPGKNVVAVAVYVLILSGFLRFTFVLVRALREQRRSG